MKQARLPSTKGMRALIEHPAGRDRSALERQLALLGLRVTAVDRIESPPWDQLDLFFFDADKADDPPVVSDMDPPQKPTIALIGSEAPSRLQALLARQPSAYLLKPIRPNGIYASMMIAVHQFTLMDAVRRRLASAEERLRSRRLVFSALLQIMKQFGVDERRAFSMLQRSAMSQRITIEALSAMLISGGVSVSQLEAASA